MIHQAYNHVVISLTAMRGVISRPLFLFCQIYSVEALFWRGSSCGAASVCLSVRLSQVRGVLSRRLYARLAGRAVIADAR